MTAFISEINYKSGVTPPEYVEIALGPGDDPADFIVSFYRNNGELHTSGLSTTGNLQNGELSLASLSGTPDPDNPEWTIYTVASTAANGKLINGGPGRFADEANYVALSRVGESGETTAIDAYGVLRNRDTTLQGGAADGAQASNLNPPGGGDTVRIDLYGNVTSGPKTAGDAVVCFAQGTLISCENGMEAVENISVGARVQTRDEGLKPVRWVGRTHLSAARLAASPHLRPIRIRAGALGGGMPHRDLLVSPQHRLLVRSVIAKRMTGEDEVLVAAKQLLALDGIEVAEMAKGVTYFHMLFERHQVVISNGAPTESLFPGPEALKSVGPEAVAELREIFPELAKATPPCETARAVLQGRAARRLAMRHGKNAKPLLSADAVI
ncbi:Hint domain-containing protein [Paracoccaceae bacterium GXU_MW_L88]